jgi:hypothetical protein
VAYFKNCPVMNCRKNYPAEFADFTLSILVYAQHKTDA